MKSREVSTNWAAWLDRPTLHPSGILLASAHYGAAPVLECYDLDGGLPVFSYSTESLDALEVIPSRPRVLSNGDILLSVYAKDQYLELVRLSPQGRPLWTHRWTDEHFPELYGADMSCKLLPGLVGELETGFYASWVYRQVRQLRTATLGPFDLQEWACGQAGELLLTTDGTSLSAWKGEELVWKKAGLRYLADPLWVLDSGEREREREERALAYVEHLVQKNLELDDYPESSWDEQHPLTRPSRVRQLAEGGTDLEIPGELRAFFGNATEWAFCSWEGGWRCHQAGSPAWTLDATETPCPLGGGWWLADDRLLFLDKGQVSRGITLPSAAYGYSPRIGERDLAWPDVVVGNDVWAMRQGPKLSWGSLR